MQPILTCRTRATLSGATVCDFPSAAQTAADRPAFLTPLPLAGSAPVNALTASVSFAPVRNGQEDSSRQMPKLLPRQGRQLRVRLQQLKPLTIHANPVYPRRVVTHLLNCSNPNRRVFENNIASFTSQFGFLIDRSPLEVGEFTYFDVSMVESCISFLRRFRDACEKGDGEQIHQMIVPNWGDLSRTLFFEPRIDEDSGRLIPELVVPTLFQFCIHELMTLYFEGRPMSSCLHCGKMSFDRGRADRRYCSTRCRTAASRLRNHGRSLGS